MLEILIFKEHKKSTCMQKKSRGCEGPLKADHPMLRWVNSCINMTLPAT